MKFQSVFVAELSQAEFALHPNSACGLYFFQPQGDGYYHALVINSSGTVDHKYYAYAVIAFINHGYLNRDLCEVRVIDEIATNQERGWTSISSVKEAVAWAVALRNSATKYLKQLESGCRTQLEAATREHRLAAARYLALTDVPVQHHRESERLAEMPGICQIPGAQELYIYTIDLLLSRSRFLTPPEDFTGLSPIDNLPYRCRIQLIADQLFWLEKHRGATFGECELQ